MCWVDMTELYIEALLLKNRGDPVYALQTASGKFVSSTLTGRPFEYSSYQLADAAARALRKEHGPLKVVRV